ncbi:acyltransferase-like protein [Balneicella halophila]|uniref:Acyltransferase-like protein n=1 Tax=Balneicella halophila TaxID=1537566 RepID=A0A7L4UMF5_BALHA|nr:lysophospholipid acyltransferase family protein [Balneicella halophila]PVX49218.1 acyltransferase-like protein [Balneicella halophila]
MIKAKHHKVIYPLFQWLSRFLINRHFNDVHINGEFADNGKPVLIIANHVSWWDGFWIMLLNLKIIKRKFHFMMLEEQLKKHWYFRYTGGYSVKKNSRSILNSISYSIELLKQTNNLVLMFPQGEIHSIYNDAVIFENGVERIIKNAAANTQIVFVTNLIDYFSDSKPNLYIYFKSFFAQDFQKTTLEKEYNTFYKQSLNFQKIKTS